MFQTPTKVTIAIAAMIGLDSGMHDPDRRRVQKPAPSIRAASSKSRGRPSKNCLNTNSAITDGTCGRITAQ